MKDETARAVDADPAPAPPREDPPRSRAAPGLEAFLPRVFQKPEALQELARRNAHAYKGAEPFPHIVLDDVFDPVVLDAVLDEFPGKDQIRWVQFDAYNEVKLATRDEEQIGPLTRCFLHYLNSKPFIEFLEELTGIGGLVPDPHFEGGGLHQILPGGKLGIHADFNKQLRLKLDRRLNALIYLNKDWKEEYGGHLELWSRDMSRCVEKVLPAYNRMVVFNTTDFAYHGHPEPLSCPPDRSRRSLALYYYTNGRPQEELSGKHSTLFQLRPGERARWKLRQLLKRLVPPILLDVARWIAARGAKRD